MVTNFTRILVLPHIDSSAVDANCKGGTTPSDSTEEHQGGRVYLAIQAAGDWTAEVQEKG
jgi:hypothetical protein